MFSTSFKMLSSWADYDWATTGLVSTVDHISFQDNILQKIGGTSNDPRISADGHNAVLGALNWAR